MKDTIKNAVKKQSKLDKILVLLKNIFCKFNSRKKILPQENKTDEQDLPLQCVSVIGFSSDTGYPSRSRFGNSLRKPNHDCPSIGRKKFEAQEIERK